MYFLIKKQTLVHLLSITFFFTKVSMEFPNGFFYNYYFIFSQCANDPQSLSKIPTQERTCRDNNFRAINPLVNESRASHDLLIFSVPSGDKQVHYHCQSYPITRGEVKFVFTLKVPVFLLFNEKIQITKFLPKFFFHLF